MTRTLWLLALTLSLGQPAAANESTTTSFPVPAVTLQPGDRLTDDVIIDKRLVASEAALRSHHTLREQVIGKVARRVLPRGAAIPVNALRQPYAFNEGERVAVEFVRDGLMIQGYGVALQPGIAGQSVRIRNIDTGVVVTGIVRPDGRVEVGGA
jgi:flagellar basal body P-ring formation protein FlgA